MGFSFRTSGIAAPTLATSLAAIPVPMAPAEILIGGIAPTAPALTDTLTIAQTLREQGVVREPIPGGGIFETIERPAAAQPAPTMPVESVIAGLTPLPQPQPPPVVIIPTPMFRPRPAPTPTRKTPKQIVDELARVLIEAGIIT